MYTPKHFAVHEQPCKDLITAYPLGLIITVGSGGIEANYLPMMLEECADGLILTGHLARANNHWKSLDQQPVSVHFLGPCSYISPSVFSSGSNVPTWNYAAVRVDGIGRVFSGPAAIENILQRSVKYFEARNQTEWKYALSGEQGLAMIRALVGFQIKVQRMEGKFKLSQNRTAADYQEVLNHLSVSLKGSDQEMRQWMQKKI